MISAQDIPYLPRGVRVHRDRVRDAWVLLAPERAITLDAIGHAILTEVDGIRSLGEITTALATKYNAPAEEIIKDSTGFLTALQGRRFLEVLS
ncbi:pyrroloquinoline quinone biosynthesis peptide chaperone PqqD [Puniceibacterium sp. IMCC21224]|uniref:pyrroloquinoline quinone biosynthesis peptide chaperone PqqD n=1 Tax=Puniceibacterium sp. IMCC21224 TaxID=1618204 RepID=UPI00064DE0F8|nr:pyrroloquinoline quinone biosynthesis peptide chaperone PqqD [Puniceibacterium sp. IMCC21224]KMK65192.1 coenzyme PQQ biosynthesis protein PqqD [Puniceibacterium sp. IMCC21224]